LEVLVSLVSFKDAVRKTLPTSSKVRKLILEEPDSLPWTEAETKIVLYIRMLKNEMENR